MTTAGSDGQRQCSYHDGERRCVRQAGHWWAHMGAEPAADLGAHVVPNAVERAVDPLPTGDRVEDWRQS